MWKYTPTFMPQKILVIGCGGTGSRLIPLLAQFVKTCSWVLEPEMVIVDDDVVEDKNLLRQNFVKKDVGKSKAEVLAQRYSPAYNIPITPIMERIHSVDQYYMTLENGEKTKRFRETEVGQKLNQWQSSKVPTLVVMCVDSAKARRSIARIILQSMAHNPCLLVDTGNENDFGQVKLLSTKSYYPDSEREISILEKVPNDTPITALLPEIPFDSDYFENMKDTTSASCADLDQTMAINSLVATVAFGLIQNWYYAKEFTAHTYSVSLTHGVIPQYFTNSYLHSINKSKTKDSYAVAAFELNKETYTLGVMHREFMDKIEQAEKEKAEKLAAENAKGDELSDEIANSDKVDPPKTSSPKRKRKTAGEATADVVEEIAAALNIPVEDSQ